MILLTALLALVLVGATATEEAVKTPLQLRAEAACQGHDKLATEAEKRARQGLLLALADTLEAEGFDVHASHCLERAGIFSYQFGEYDQAGAIWDRGLETARRSGDPKRVGALLNASAIGVSVTGDNERAVELQLELIRLRREIDDRRGEGSSWYNLAYSYAALYRIPESIEAYRHALVLLEEVGNDYGVALSRNALSNQLYEIGQIEESLALADSAVMDAEREGAPLLVANALGARGYKKYGLGRNEAALADFERARQMLLDGGVARVAAITAINHARTLVALGRCEEALALLDESWVELDPQENRAERVAARSARGRALEGCGREEEAREELRQTLAELDDFRAELDTELGRAEAFRVAGDACTNLAALEDPPEAWGLVEDHSASLLRARMATDVVALDRFQSELGRIGAVALQYGVPTPERVVVCVITPDTVRTRTLPLPADFGREVATAMQLLAGGSPGDLCRPVLTRISDVLLAGLDLRADRLIVIPGGLAGLPFEALAYGDVELGERFAITYAPSATAFVRLQERGAAATGMLALADPAPGDESAEDLEGLAAMRRPMRPLPQAREEVSRVAAAGAIVLEDAGATRQGVLDHAAHQAVIHFATHAVVDASNPERSAILLAGSEELDAGTIEGLGLAADLVSLSGCSTAAGYLVAGEGTLGLTRAFLVAGARSVVASWWDVEDAAARRFMELFYGDLRAGLDRDRALQNARRTMAAEGFAPRDRLAFALVGATAAPVPALQHESPLPRLRVLMAMLGLVLVLWWVRRARQG